MTQIKVRLLQAEIVERALRGFAGDGERVARGALEARGNAAIRALGEYPRPYAGRPAHRWASERQRRFVMAGLRDGSLRVPYQRERGYAAAWHLEREATGFRLTTAGRFANRYAAYVGGNARGGRQYHLHAGRWPLAKEVIAQQMERLPAEVLENVRISGRRHGLTVR